jgi:hypothetical protein
MFEPETAAKTCFPCLVSDANSAVEGRTLRRQPSPRDEGMAYRIATHRRFISTVKFGVDIERRHVSSPNALKTSLSWP